MIAGKTGQSCPALRDKNEEIISMKKSPLIATTLILLVLQYAAYYLVLAHEGAFWSAPTILYLLLVAAYLAWVGMFAIRKLYGAAGTPRLARWAWFNLAFTIIGFALSLPLTAFIIGFLTIPATFLVSAVWLCAGIVTDKGASPVVAAAA
jgi:hypothetical protein